MRKVFLEEEKRPVFPEGIRRMVQGSALYDSSCGDTARVYYADKGLYVKEAAGGSLCHEAEMGRIFHAHHLGPEVVLYLPGEKDYLVTREVEGQDLCHLLDNPLLLCRQMGEKLRLLHSIPGDGMPRSPSLSFYRQGVQENKETFEKYVMLERFPIACREDALSLARAHLPGLQQDVLIHGDACLPNMMMKNGKIVSFIDFAVSGAGDRHIDLFWALWSLQFNLRTEKYADDFLDAYGRADVDEEKIRAVSALEALG